MKLGNDARSFMRNAFPGRGQVIDRGIREYASFQELCVDYRRCAVALDEWRQADSGNSERVREYEELLSELVREIEGWLDALEEGRA